MEPPQDARPTVLRRTPAPAAAPAAPTAPATPPPPVAAPRSALPARATLAAFALAILALSGYLLWDRGFVLTLQGIAGLSARLALAAVLLALARWPAQAARVVRAPFLATPQGLAAAALAAGALYFVFGLGTVVETARLVEEVQAGTPAADLPGTINRADLLFSLALNMLIFTVPALLWASWAEGRPGPGAFAWLGLRREGLAWSAGWSLIAVLVVFWLLVLFGLVSRLLGQGEVANPRAEAIAASLDVPSALLVAIMTGIGEEVFFRGLLQRKVGNVPQALLFGLAHLNYLQFLEVGVTALLGYGFGRAVQKTGNLWGPVLGHAAFNAASLLLILGKSNGWFG